MTEKQLRSPEPAATPERVPPSVAYRELARTADQELREWVLRRARRRAHNRGVTPAAEDGAEISE